MTLSPKTPAQDVCAMAFDAIHSNAIYLPRDAFAVGGYINGANTSFIWTSADWAMFPNSYHIRINVTGDPTRGNCLDIETEDATPAMLPEWINTRAPVVRGPLLAYCNRSNIAAVLTARSESKFPQRTWIWAATDDGSLVTNHAMTQAFQMSIPSVVDPVADVSIILDPTLRALMAGASA
jgi:hypothetical protein